MGTTCIIGFDSAWTDNVHTPGAICALVLNGKGAVTFESPQHALFGRAIEFIGEKSRVHDTSIVAIDQPTIVPNVQGCRPVDRVAGALVSFMGGGVQPANRSKKGIFDNGAPIWRFKESLSATEDPELSRRAECGLFIIEVFPALALPTFEVSFNGYLKGPKYNPKNPRFHLSDWILVIDAIAKYARDAKIKGLEIWTRTVAAERAPCKADQDQIDSVLCALIGHHWRVRPRASSVMIGDLKNGYMITPADLPTKTYLKAAAAKRGVPMDGI
jgi:predicted RNase H-like nuclease